MLKKLKTIFPIAVIAIIGGLIRHVHSLKFVTPPLVEGPRIVFFIPLPEFLHKVPLAMNMGDGRFGLPVTITVVTTWLLIALIFMFFKLGTRNLKIIPGRLQLLLEIIYSFLVDIIDQMMDKWRVRYFSYIGPLFLFIFTANIVGFFPIPWVYETTHGIMISPALRVPTADLNTTVGLALLTTFMFLKAGIESDGVLGYLKGFLAPIPIMLPLNVVGEFAKPVNISMRLFGNAFAGSVIMGLLYMGAPAVVPAALHLYFDLFAGLVQSFVFVMLSMVYIRGAIGDREFPSVGDL